MSSGFDTTSFTLLRVCASISGTQALSNGSAVAIAISCAPTVTGSTRRTSA